MEYLNNGIVVVYNVVGIEYQWSLLCYAVRVMLVCHRMAQHSCCISLIACVATVIMINNIQADAIIVVASTI